MALTTEEVTKYTAYLDQAESAYHKLMSGQAVVEFHDQNGEQVHYNRAGAKNLLAYINSLRRLLGKPDLTLGMMSAPPMGVIL